MINGYLDLEEQIKAVTDDAKRAYMQRIWTMDKKQIFHELMRVHGESARLLNQANAELLRLRELLEQKDGDAIH
jgi:hypothetical protein